MSSLETPSDTTVARARGFFRELTDTHRRAEEAAGGAVTRCFGVGGRTFRLRFAGPGLVETMTRALRHVEVDPVDEPDFEIRLWDSATTGTRPPRAPWTNDQLRPRGELDGFNGDGLHTAFVPGSDAFCMLDAASGEGLFWVEDGTRVVPWVVGTPLRYHFSWALGGDSSQMVHAGAVGTPDGGVLLTGRGGSGKSTAVLACVGSGLQVAGDDLVIARSEPEPRVHSAYSAARLHPGHVERFPHLARLAVRLPGDDKVTVFLHEHFPGALGASFPLRAILLPRVVEGGATRIVPASRGECLAALAPSTLFLLPGAAHRSLRAMAALAGRLPAHTLELGDDLDRVPELIGELLAR